jgi:hypothetical protein
MRGRRCRLFLLKRYAALSHRRVKTLKRSGCIISFADMSTYVMKVNAIVWILLMKGIKMHLLRNVGKNLKKMIQGG